MQESRLFQIVYYLLDKGQATAPELAVRFEVSVRTIYRDIDSLSAAGIPIYAEAGRNGGIRLMHDFVLDHAVLSETFSNEELFSKGVFPWVGGSTLGSYFVSNTSSHYDWAMKKLKAHKKNCAGK